MNKQRRGQLQDIIARLEIISEDLESLRDEEDDYRDNIPENLQGSEKYENSENASYSMDEAIDNISSAVDSINEAIDY